MIRALYTAATGMDAQQTNLDVIANNLANVNTVGFKKSRADFQDLMYQYVVEPGAQTSQVTFNPTGVQVGLGVKTASVQKMFTQGDLSSTGSQFDVAIEGDGFMQILRPDGTFAYTRAGTLQLDFNGQLVTSDGFQIAPGINIPPDALGITIAQDGTVSVRQPNTPVPTQVGQITGVRFPNNAGLRAVGQNLYEETQASGAPVVGIFNQLGFGRLNQGFLESSNVSVVDQVVSMITAQRAYEASSKGITTADEMLSAAINIKR
ncbi:MAG: flagellar basal-body rod protein FlgG [Pseudomonadota bacterium]